MSGENREIFATIRIDEPNVTGHQTPEQAQPSVEPASHMPEPKNSGFWHRLITSIKPIDKDAHDKLAPVEGTVYRMVPMAEVIDALKIKNEDDGYLDDAALASLRARLSRLGLATATNITGPLRLRCTDSVPIINADEPQPSRYTTITICLYLIAWMLQGDSPSAQDLSIIDEWIDTFDPKANWTESAKGTLRWLLSRKLFLTSKRKQRTGRIKRYAHIRAKLLEVLLRLVANPQHATLKRMKRLETIYSTIGLDPDSIHSDLHRLATTSVSTRRHESAKASTIDTAKLKEMAHSTRQAQQILAGVFATETETAPHHMKGSKKADPTLRILRQLADMTEWPREEAEAIARKHGLTLGAMLERINDYAFSKANEAVADDDGVTIYIDTEVLKAIAPPKYEEHI